MVNAGATSPSKTKRERLTPPDRALQEEVLAKIKKSIDEIQKQIKDLSAEISEKTAGKEEFIRKRDSMKKKLGECQSEIDNLEKLKQAEWAQIKGKKEEDRKNRSDLQTAKKKLPFGSIEEIDAKIKEIEYKISHSVLPLREEKLLVQKISQMNAAKQDVRKLTKKSEGGVAVPGMDDIDRLNSLISDARKQKKAQMDELQKLSAMRQETIKGVPQLYEKRDMLNNQIAKKVQERQAIQADFRKRMQEYQAQQAEANAARTAKMHAQRLQRQADNEISRLDREDEAEEQQPFLAETTLLEQTISYCQDLVAEKVKVKEEEKKQTVFDNPQGSTVLASKKDRGSEMFCQGTGGKKLRKRGTKDDAKAKDTKIKHTVESLQVFSTLKLSPPITTADIPALLTELNEQLDGYKEKVKVWEDEKGQRAELAAQKRKEAEQRAKALEQEAKAAYEAYREKQREMDASFNEAA